MTSRKTSTAVVLATLFFLLFAVPSAYAASTTTQSTPTTQPVAATHPSASCRQPNRNQAISTLTPQERLDQGYPLPVNGKTDPNVDQIVHDKGVHFCADTDVPRPVQPSIASHSESNQRQWSGNYADGGGNYTYVQMFWYESCILQKTQTDYYATWAGIGGVGNNNLVQTGADGLTEGGTYQSYYTWVENTADGYNAVMFNINCGDAMAVEVASGNCMYVIDETSGQNSGWRCTGPNANSSTAECIVEAPTIGSSVANLSNYGTETLSACQVEVNAGSNQGIGNVPHDYYNMYNGSTLLSSTGPISNGDTYTMTWHNYS